jgi:hypothetical protein
MKIRQEYSFQKLRRGRDIADELNVAREMRKQIMGGEFVCKCPACEVGFLHLKDPVERIGQCDYCFEEIKLN